MWIAGDVKHGLRFFDRDGNELRRDARAATGVVVTPAPAADPPSNARALPEPAMESASEPAPEPAPPDARALSTPPGMAPRVRFHDLPQEIDAEWWARHAHLFSWKGNQLVFEPGVAREPIPVASAGPPADARASRPQTLADVIGQQRVVDGLRLSVSAARTCGEALPHVLLCGPPGLGKTSLARAVSTELATGFHGVHGPAIDDPRELLRMLLSIRDRDVVFVDEIHALSPRVAESLYEAMEDGRLSLPVRCEGHERALSLRLARFTLIGATTDEDRLPEPMRQRFEIRERLEFYSAGDLGTLLARGATRLGLELDARASQLMAGASRGTPREALALLGAARNEAIHAGATRIDESLVRRAFERRGIDELGLYPFEREYLRVLREADRPLGLATLAARLGTSRRALQSVYEPFLIRSGLVRMTPFGRVG